MKTVREDIMASFSFFLWVKMAIEGGFGLKFDEGEHILCWPRV